MTHRIWDVLEKRYSESPYMYAGPQTEEEVSKHESEIDFELPPDYRKFIRKFGAGNIGSINIIGIGASKIMGKEESSFVEVTRFFRNQEWDGTENWIVIAVDHSGNPYGLDRQGRVWLSDHDHGEVVQVADSFGEFVASHLK